MRLSQKKKKSKRRGWRDGLSLFDPMTCLHVTWRTHTYNHTQIHVAYKASIQTVRSSSQQTASMALPACAPVSVFVFLSVAHSFLHLSHSDLKPFTSRLADYLVLAKVRQALGFAKCQKNFYGAAPMTAETQRFFLGLNIRLYAGYGLSESTGPHFMSSPYNYRLYR